MTESNAPRWYEKREDDLCDLCQGGSAGVYRCAACTINKLERELRDMEYRYNDAHKAAGIALEGFCEFRQYAVTLRKFIEALPCPNPQCSDGSIVNTGPDPQNDACEWCYVRHMVLDPTTERNEIGTGTAIDRACDAIMAETDEETRARAAREGVDIEANAERCRAMVVGTRFPLAVMAGAEWNILDATGARVAICATFEGPGWQSENAALARLFVHLANRAPAVPVLAVSTAPPIHVTSARGVNVAERLAEMAGLNAKRSLVERLRGGQFMENGQRFIMHAEAMGLLVEAADEIERLQRLWQGLDLGNAMAERGGGWVKVHRLSDEAADALVALLNGRLSQGDGNA